MEVSEFSLRLFFLFLPGVFAFVVADKLTYHKEVKLYQVILFSLLLGLVSYATLFCLIFGWHALTAAWAAVSSQQVTLTRPRLIFLDALRDKAVMFSYREIVWATLLAVGLGFVVALLINRKVLHQIATKLGVSNKYGDYDVWSYLMNSPQLKQWPWVVVRDKKHDIMYQGRVALFGDTPGTTELYLQDVQVYRDSAGTFLYAVPGLYLPAARQEIEVEFYFNPRPSDLTPAEPPPNATPSLHATTPLGAAPVAGALSSSPNVLALPRQPKGE